MTVQTESLLAVTDLRVEVGQDAARTEIVHDISLSVPRGGALAIVGESGSGKTLTALSMIGLLPPGVHASQGLVDFDGRDLLQLGDVDWQGVRGRDIAMIFQDPTSALNPCLTVGYQIAEMFRRHQGMARGQAYTQAVDLMTQVGIPDAARRVTAYPHQFSGGMRQRIMIAMALALGPRLLIADEPTTALDVTVQAQILRLLKQRRADDELALILITHDLGVVARVAESVAVMYAGRIVEHGPVPEVYSRPAHPYTRGLIGTVPTRTGGRSQLASIEGQPPDPASPPDGCAFHPRCPLAQPICRTERPPLRPLTDGRSSACHFAEDVLGGADD
ncbi:MAG: ATP-binding cassette domain-containing protein [Streptosporangiales bacterium]|nr:ATP-binding cassette domain-containing protein [Streptosporangiales bacterium]